ncbi:SDR family NAD(P)-dependent oxidoreductase [Yinghuangia soli]|uniref:SDR family NAD(P)-dependent oxidoreductase n=1 Tax=Yinghuangia soli TaxID=2908204 RepID=A0AA41PXE3_9ACTN|nr:SDR family NAD(P)-dependent oxidoreductase [Yinghuangia soli]MCF2527614.1 SDR family NAD(P)-dependent oxidoreductase [Yinghuangia soli]
MPTYGPDTTTDEVIAGIDLTGRTAVVTGGTSGLGLHTAGVLADAGAHVVLTARDEEKGAAAVAELAGEGRSVEAGVLDLTALASVRTFAAWLLERHPRIDLLVNNAGVMATPFGHTADGFELQFGTNHLGHFLLTNLLVPALRRGAPARVVNLSSAGHVASDILWDDPNFAQTEYHPWTAYGQSKTANVLFTVELDRRLAGHGVRAYAVHPGMIRTNLGRYMNREQGAALQSKVTRANMPAMKSVPAGAATQVWAATAPELADQGGVYLEDCGVSAKHAAWARDPESAVRLWTLSEEFVGEKFPEV